MKSKLIALASFMQTSGIYSFVECAKQSSITEAADLAYDEWISSNVNPPNPDTHLTEHCEFKVNFVLALAEKQPS